MLVVSRYHPFFISSVGGRETSGYLWFIVPLNCVYSPLRPILTPSHVWSRRRRMLVSGASVLTLWRREQPYSKRWVSHSIVFSEQLCHVWSLWECMMEFDLCRVANLMVYCVNRKTSVGKLSIQKSVGSTLGLFLTSKWVQQLFILWTVFSYLLCYLFISIIRKWIPTVYTV